MSRLSDSRIQFSIALSAFSLFSIFIIYYFTKEQIPRFYLTNSDEQTVFVLFGVSILAFLFLLGGYLLNLFTPADVGDAFTVLDLGLIAAWVALLTSDNERPFVAALYGLPIVFRFIDVRDRYMKKGAVKKAVGHCALFIFLYFATIHIQFGGDNGTPWIYTLAIPGWWMYGMTIIGTGLVGLLYFLFRLIPQGRPAG